MKISRIFFGLLILASAYFAIASAINLRLLPDNVPAPRENEPKRATILRRSEGDLKNKKMTLKLYVFSYGISFIASIGLFLKRRWGRPLLTAALGLLIAVTLIEGNHEQKYLGGVIEKIHQSVAGENVTQDDRFDASVGLEYINNRQIKTKLRTWGNVAILLLVGVFLFRRKAATPNGTA